MSETRESPVRQRGGGRDDQDDGSGALRRTDVELGEGYAAGELPDEPAGRRASLWADAWRELRTNPLFLFSAAIILLFSAMAVFPQFFVDLVNGADPHAANLSNSLDRPSAAHPFGFDLQGRDYLARVVHGARVSMTIGVIVVGGAALIALVVGSIAGFFGRATDAVLSRVTDVFFAIPTVLAGLVFLTALDGEMSLLGVTFNWNSFDQSKIIRVILVLVLFGWPTMMRIARSAVIGEKEKEYVTAARALGASNTRIIARHILPNAIAPVIVYATIFTGIIIAAEATLSFLGVGLQLPAISWGLMVSGAQDRVLQAPHLLLFPGLFLSLTVFGFILMGDALRDALDPKLR